MRRRRPRGRVLPGRLQRGTVPSNAPPFAAARCGLIDAAARFSRPASVHELFQQDMLFHHSLWHTVSCGTPSPMAHRLLWLLAVTNPIACYVPLLQPVSRDHFAFAFWQVCNELSHYLRDGRCAACPTASESIPFIFLLLALFASLAALRHVSKKPAGRPAVSFQDQDDPRFCPGADPLEPVCSPVSPTEPQLLTALPVSPHRPRSACTQVVATLDSTCNVKLPPQWTYWTRVFAWVGDLFGIFTSIVPERCLSGSGTFESVLLVRGIAPLLLIVCVVATMVAYAAAEARGAA
jgi:hypothetical protein